LLVEGFVGEVPARDATAQGKERPSGGSLKSSEGLNERMSFELCHECIISGLEDVVNSLNYDDSKLRRKEGLVGST
jgi:hypothetical protein